MIYALVARLLAPAAWWGRLRVEGVEHVPYHGALLLVPNHDSQWDPVVIALALRRRRQLRYLGRASLWRIPVLRAILKAARQIPIRRGARDVDALWHAVSALDAGEAVCIFPEGALSRGERLRARSGVGRLANACPQARVLLCTVEGATDYVRFPRRPRVRVSFFEPAAGQPAPSEDPAAMAERFLAEIRERVPPAPAGRRRAR